MRGKDLSERNSTIRRQIVALLQEGECSARDISQGVGISEKEVVNHMDHIRCSLRGKNLKLRIRPAECLKCGYEFTDRRRITSPGRCPKCKESHLSPPLFSINMGV